MVAVISGTSSYVVENWVQSQFVLEEENVQCRCRSE